MFDVRTELVISINFLFEMVKLTLKIWKKKQTSNWYMKQARVGTEIESELNKEINNKLRKVHPTRPTGGAYV